MTPENIARLRDLAGIARIEWRVADPVTKAFCMSYDRSDTLTPEEDANAWLEDQCKRFPGSRFAHYKVIRVEVRSELQQLATELLAACAATPMVETKVALDEWLKKTEWVRKTLQPRELGKHTADVLRERLDSLGADAARYAFLCSHPDWRFVEALCLQFSADDARQFKAGMDRAIDALRAANPTNWEMAIAPSPTQKAGK